MPLNIQGRICLPASLLFGVGGLLAVYVLMPAVMWVDGAVPSLVLELSALAIAVLISIDATITCLSLTDLMRKVLTRGALLHDYYLYDWHHCENKAHAVNHPVIALGNAVQDFELSRRERNIIASHMWPLPPTRVPKCREAWIVCMADKVCSLQETLFMR